MVDHGTVRPSPKPATSRVHYRETVRVPWWWWPAGLALTLLLAAELHGGEPGLRAVLPYAVLVPLTVAGLWSLSRTRVQVDEEALRVLDAHLPLWAVGAVRTVDRETMRTARARDLDPAAFAVIRGWVGTGVWVQVDDEHDDTPYWLVSTRQPERLAAELARAAGLPDDDPAGSGPVPEPQA